MASSWLGVRHTHQLRLPKQSRPGQAQRREKQASLQRELGNYTKERQTQERLHISTRERAMAVFKPQGAAEVWSSVCGVWQCASLRRAVLAQFALRGVGKCYGGGVVEASNRLHFYWSVRSSVGAARYQDPISLHSKSSGSCAAFGNSQNRHRSCQIHECKYHDAPRKGGDARITGLVAYRAYLPHSGRCTPELGQRNRGEELN